MQAIHDWCDAYRQHFVTFAVARGWAPDNAADWAGSMDEYAYVDSAAACPMQTAEMDVLACEMETP